MAHDIPNVCQCHHAMYINDVTRMLSTEAAGRHGDDLIMDDQHLPPAA